QHVRRRVTAADVVGFLLSDQNFPRAVAWCLQALQQGLEALPRNADCARIVEDLQGHISRSEPEAFSSEDLHGFIDQLQLRLAQLHTAIEATWFLKPANS
ncbi:MAG: alpha-E domain-containing protein, partial [Pseudomonadales bacterium]